MHVMHRRASREIIVVNRALVETVEKFTVYQARRHPRCVAVSQRVAEVLAVFGKVVEVYAYAVVAAEYGYCRGKVVAVEAHL